MRKLHVSNVAELVKFEVRRREQETPQFASAPTVHIEWSAEELARLKAATQQIAPAPNAKLRELMRAGVSE